MNMDDNNFVDFDAAPPKKSNKTLYIIIGVVAVILCCCCVLGYVGYTYGDQWFGDLFNQYFY